jgi:hypothetical protein
MAYASRDWIGMKDGQMRRAVADRTRRWRIDLAILLSAGLLMAFLGPFLTGEASVLSRTIYWVVCLVGGGLIAIAADELLPRAKMEGWQRVAASCLLATPPAALFVLTIDRIFGAPFRWSDYAQLLWQVWPILLAVLAVRALVWKRSPSRVETRILIAPPLPEAEAAFRQRLSARYRNARLIAIEAHDHYLRVHTDVGSELIALRLRDAVAELQDAHGWRVHRSWWVAADAVLGGRWHRNFGELRLLGGFVAPVSRSYAPLLRAAGWF